MAARPNLYSRVAALNHRISREKPKEMAYLNSFLEDVKINRVDSATVSEKTTTNTVTSGVAPTIFNGFGLFGSADMSTDETIGPVTQFTNLEKYSLEDSPQLSSFIRTHIEKVVRLTPSPYISFCAKPTEWSGSVSFLIAIVVATLDGTSEAHEKTASGTVEVSSALDEDDDTDLHDSLSQQPTGILGASYLVVHVQRSWTKTGIKLEVMEELLVKNKADKELQALIRRVRYRQVRKLIYSNGDPGSAFVVKRDPGMGASDFEDDTGAFLVDKTLKNGEFKYLLLLTCSDEDRAPDTTRTVIVPATLCEFYMLCEAFKCPNSLKMNGKECDALMAPDCAFLDFLAHSFRPSA